MFGFLKKKQPPATDPNQIKAALSRDSAAAVELIKEKWLGFHQTVQMKADISLAQKIEAFSVPMHQLYENRFPLLAVGPTSAGMFWMTLFTAILESDTHPKDTVNAAIAELKKKFGQGGARQ